MSGNIEKHIQSLEEKRSIRQLSLSYCMDDYMKAPSKATATALIVALNGHLSACETLKKASKVQIQRDQQRMGDELKKLGMIF